MIAIQSRTYENTRRFGTYDERAIDTGVLQIAKRLECLLHWVCRRRSQAETNW